jgi:hypothetical protein
VRDIPAPARPGVASRRLISKALAMPGSADPRYARRSARASGIASLLLALLLGGTALSACSAGSTTSAKLSNWIGATGLGSDVSQIRTDAANVAKVESIKNALAGAIRANCAVLDIDTENANQNLPAPDAEVTQDLSDAYGAEIQAAQDCYHGAGKSQALIDRGKVAQTAANADLTQALALVDQLTGQKVG